MADPLLGWAMIGAGAFGQTVAALLARRSLRSLQAGGRALGRVVRNEEAVMAGGSGSPRRFYFPVIEFTSEDGMVTTFQSDTGRRVPIPIGAMQPVVFDPSRPSQASLATFRALWLFPLLMSAFSLPFLLAGWVALRLP